MEALKRAGWRVLTIWECALKGKSRLHLEDVVEKAASWLASGKKNHVIEGSMEKKKAIPV